MMTLFSQVNLYSHLLFLGPIIFLCSLFAMKFLHRFVRVKRLMDFPNPRKSHKKIIPLFGGIVFVSVFLLTILGHVFYGYFESYFLFFIGAGLIFILGLMDDIFSLDWRYKLTGQLLVLFCCVPLIKHFSLFGIDFSVALSQIIFIIWFLGITNSMNLLDGLDGLAAGVFIFYLLGLMYMAITSSVLTSLDVVSMIVMLICCVLPFLILNFYPAKMYMGSAGSLFLGYFLATVPVFMLSVGDSYHETTFNFTFFVLIYAYIIFDTLRVFFIRLFNKKNPFLPDQNHLHHVMVKRLGVFKSVVGIYAINFLIIVVFICLY